MSICFFASILILVATIFAPVYPDSVLRSFDIKKDFFNGIKAGEFSIFHHNEEQLQYRVESQYSFMQSVELVAYPSKQIVAKLKKKFKLFLYKGTISILDPRSNQWINGTIRQEFGGKFKIEWNEQSITMRTKFASWNTDFHDDSDGTLLAQYRTKLISLIWSNRYELQVFSDKFPDAVYFLALVARDHVIALARKKRDKTGHIHD